MQTLKLSAEEARRLAGDVIPLAGAPQQGARIGFTLRVPLGVVARDHAVQLAAQHGRAQDRAGVRRRQRGDPEAFEHTPLTACILVEVLLDAGVPRGFLSLFYGSAEVAGWLLDDAARALLRVHRQHRGRPQDPAGGGPAAHADGTRLDRLHDPVRRREPRQGAAQGHQRQLSQGGPGLHLDPAAARARFDRRRGAERASPSW